MEFLDAQCAARSSGPGNLMINTLLSALVSLHCNISDPGMWPDDYGPTALGGAMEPYDFIVVGGGTSGSVVASRLAENPDYRVLLLEAGDDPPIESEMPSMAFKARFTDGDWQYPTTSNQLSCMAMRDESCIWHRGKVLGGTSSMDSMLYSQGTSRDFDYWEYKGNSMWSWRDIQPSFKKLENFQGYNQYKAHGTEGPVTIEAFWSPKHDQNLILEAARELGHPQVNDFVHENHLGFGWFYGMVDEGWRVSSAKAYLSGVKGHRSNLHVIKNAIAKEISFGSKNKAETVKFVYEREHNLEAKAKREIIVAAGPIETPKLLMLSGIGPSTQLRSLGIPIVKDSPVGENLMDHPRVDLFFKFDLKYKTTSETRLADAVYSQLIHRYDATGGPILDIGGFINTRNSSRYPDVMFAFMPITNITEFGVDFKDSIMRSLERQIRSTDHCVVMSVILLRQKSRGHVRLQSNDYRDKPLIIPNTFQKDVDVETIVNGIKEIMKFEQTAAFERYHGKFIKINIPACNSERHRSVKYWNCYAKYMSNSFDQHAGTAKMGPATDFTSVVDSELRVRGVRGLRVVDSSIMPTMITGPITAATIMIGEKGAETILEGWKDNP